jgi:hypothetical protein
VRPSDHLGGCAGDRERPRDKWINDEEHANETHVISSIIVTLDVAANGSLKATRKRPTTATATKMMKIASHRIDQNRRIVALSIDRASFQRRAHSSSEKPILIRGSTNGAKVLAQRAKWTSEFVSKWAMTVVPIEHYAGTLGPA